jgi:hypothetical protein
VTAIEDLSFEDFRPQAEQAEEERKKETISAIMKIDSPLKAKHLPGILGDISNQMSLREEPVEYYPKDSCETQVVATDCEIDDIELLISKKHLMVKATPLSLVNVLQSKYPKLNITEQLVEDGKDIPGARHNNPNFICTVKMNSMPQYVGVSLEPNKQRARHVAAQRFLKSLFASNSFTWNKICHLIITLKEPLALVLK